LFCLIKTNKKTKEVRL